MKYQVPITPGQRLLQSAAAIAGFLRSHTKQLYKTIKHRRDIAVLVDQDDRLLADIGITRSDVHHAIRLPLWRDPTEMLRRRAGAQPRRQGQAVCHAGEAVGGGGALAAVVLTG